MSSERSLTFPLGPIAVRLRGSPRGLLAPLLAPGPGWHPPVRGVAACPLALTVRVRALPCPTTAGETTFAARGRTLHGESPLWRLTFAPRRHHAQVWLAPEDPPYRPGDAIRSALRALLSLQLLWRRGATAHAAVVVRRGSGIVALGRSGAGKTTLAGRFGWDRVLADDCAAIHRDRRGYLVTGTPFRGREGRLGDEGTARLRLLAVLRKAEGARSRATPLSPTEALPALVSCLHAPGAARPLRERALSVALRLARRVPCVLLDVNLEDDPWSSIRAHIHTPRPTRS